MRKLLFIIILLLICGFSYSQNILLPVSSDAVKAKSVDVQDEDYIYNMAGIETKPEFPGGISMFYKYVSKKFRIPKSKDFKGGKVLATFVIEKDGSVTDIKILRDPGFETNKETKRVLISSPKWKAGVQNGKNVRVQYMLPITLSSN